MNVSVEFALRLLIQNMPPNKVSEANMLIILRGLPGSGKSTEAARLQAMYRDLGVSCVVCSNDLYPGYYENGSYEWTPEKANRAKMWCWTQFLNSLYVKTDVIILDNTNLNSKSYGKYLRLAKEYGRETCFVEFRPPLENPNALEEYIQECAVRNTHGVKYGTIKQMASAWEDNKVVKEKK